MPRNSMQRRGMPLLWRGLIACMLALFASVSFAAAPNGSWWDTTFPYRYKLTIPAGTSALDDGYAVSVTFDHAAVVTAGTSLASGDDVRIVHWNGSAWVELDRVSNAPETWNTASTRVWFKTAAAIASGGNNDDYYLYYGKLTATGPPANGENVFLLHDEFAGAALDTARWTASGTGTITVSGGNLTLFPGRVLQSDTTFGLDTIWEARALTSDTLPGGGSKSFYLWMASNSSTYNSNHVGFFADVDDYFTTGRNFGTTNDAYTNSAPTSFRIYSFTREFVTFFFIPYPYSNFRIDGTLINTISTSIFSYNLPTAALPVLVRNDANGSRTQVYDWMRVRPYRNPEPVPTTGPLEQVSSGLDHFVVTHDGYGINCLAETITVSPKDSANTNVITYNQNITLTTNTGKGTWTKLTGTGAFTDATANDGLATYQWVSGETSASFSLFYPEGTQSFDVDAYQTSNTSLRDDDTEGNLSFSPVGFTIANVTGVAGTAYDTTITAYGQTSSDPLCGVIKGYTLAKSLKFWTSYTNPATGTVRVTVGGTTSAATEGAAAAQTVNFASGVATVSVKYKDAGQVTLNVKDDTTGNPSLPTGIRGSGTLTLKPARFGLVATGTGGVVNPAAADATGGAFIAAGLSFSVTATAYDAEGSVTPNYGKETSPESVALTQALVAPSPGVNGVFTNAAFGAFNNGSATASNLSWAEVGIISLTPRVADGNYLTAGDVTATAINVGRFVPADFAVSVATSPVLPNACVSGGFSYVGQPFSYTTAPILTVTARNTSGGTTQNYTGAFYKLTSPNGQTTYTSSTGPALVGTAIDPTSTSLGAGLGRLTYPTSTLGVAFDRTATAPIAPFTPTITLNLALRDTDNVAVVASPYTLAMTAGVQRYGRLAFRNAVGSELIPLSMPLRAEFFLSNEQGFVTNTSDKCSTGISVSLNTYGGSLSAGETCVLDSSGASCATAPSISSRVMNNGDFNLKLAAPGVGNQGTVTLSAPTLPPWLQYDWDSATLGIQNPTGMATFGIYQGNSTRLYTRERY